MTSERRSGADRRQGVWRAQDRLRSIVERMADGIVVVSLDGVVRFANPAAERLFARPAAQLRGTSFGVPIVAGESAEVEVVRPDGQSISVELRVTDTDWEGEAAHLGSLRDITDRKRAEERAEQLEKERVARAEAESASRAKSGFLAMMSHELRTPLNAVIGYAELLDLSVGGPLNDGQHQHIARILASARHLLRLVNELLDLANADAGHLTVRSGVALASETANEALAIIQPLADAHGISVAERCRGSANAKYSGDRDRVREILLNLLDNAVKFSSAGARVTLVCGRARRAEPDAEPEASGRWVCWRVSDMGSGIPADRLREIFDPFVQGESGHTRPAEGSGLGLAISRRLARAMGGELTVRSEVGRGSSFTLCLPEAMAEGEPEHPAESAVAVPNAETAFGALAQAGSVLLRQLEPLVNAFVLRLRSEKLLSPAASLHSSQLANHIPTYVADVGEALIAADAAGGRPSHLVAECSEIQRLVAERHGAQRARLGWSPEAIQREWSVLHEEIDRIMQEGSSAGSDTSVAVARRVVDRFLEQGRNASRRALEHTIREGALRAPIRGQV